MANQRPISCVSNNVCESGAVLCLFHALFIGLERMNEKSPLQCEFGLVFSACIYISGRGTALQRLCWDLRYARRQYRLESERCQPDRACDE